MLILILFFIVIGLLIFIRNMETYISKINKCPYYIYKNKLFNTDNQKNIDLNNKQIRIIDKRCGHIKQFNDIDKNLNTLKNYQKICNYKNAHSFYSKINKCKLGKDCIKIFKRKFDNKKCIESEFRAEYPDLNSISN